jgi:hypothetical protein
MSVKFVQKASIGLFVAFALFSCSKPANIATEPARIQANNAADQLFQANKYVSVTDFFKVLAAQVPLWESAPAVKKDYQDFLSRNALSDTAALYHDYVRVRMAFEATRAGGLWHIMWNVTNQQPQSDLIWAQFKNVRASSMPKTSAVAECDELSAGFVTVARGIGLSKQSHVGLFWTTSNHTVAVWVPNPSAAKPVRVVVPTSQVFLDGAQSLDTKAFNPWLQKNIFDYKRADVSAQDTLDADFARAMIQAVQKSVDLSQADLQKQRNAVEYAQRQQGN